MGLSDMVKRKSGRPPKFSSPEELQAKIDQYFDFCKGQLATDCFGNPIVDKHSKPVILGARPPTICGLAFFLGMSRRSLLNYKSRPAFEYVVSRARLRIEMYTNERLFDREGYYGSRFVLSTSFAQEAADEEENPPRPVAIVPP